MQRARQLFAIAIETPGGLKVQTIHAFCERLLQRFPLEAGVAPGFAILDDQERNALLREAIDEVLTEATSNVRSPIAKALQSAIGFATEGDFDLLLGEALRERDWLSAAVRLDDEDVGDFAGAEAIYRVALGLDESASLEDVEQAARIAALEGGADSGARCAGHGQRQRREGRRAAGGRAQGGRGGGARRWP